MATRGLKKPRGRTVALAFDEGLVGLVGRLAEPINLADAQKHPSFKYIPAVKEDRFRAFLGVPIIQRASCWACWWSSSASCVSLMKAKSLSSSPSPPRWRRSSPSPS
ncbi:phosphocarrier protein kinase/phosphorylase [Klebsiella pneumoniae]|uniref:Phosphocarrier protein kinase/phosphorylase n=1 Tax=Klebsiella pneumoniae TaxID=573 RepID=A0A378BUR3_KLEPN|nr:phosphocarrier protein kinase/phosphorylase [Klebsiella pneumoniae]